MILREDTAHKTYKLTAVLNKKLRYINQTHLVIKLVHVLGALIQIYDIAGNLLNLAVHPI